MTASDYAAWWGAVVASIAVVWNIRQDFRSGPRIHVEAHANIKTVGIGEESDRMKRVAVTVINRGTASTTIKNVGGWRSPTLAERIKRTISPDGFLFSPVNDMGPNVPHLIEPGTTWTISGNQDEVEKVHKGSVVIAVYCSHRKRPYSVKVKLPR